jgi:hypothetical protein
VVTLGRATAARLQGSLIPQFTYWTDRQVIGVGIDRDKNPEVRIVNGVYFKTQGGESPHTRQEAQLAVNHRACGINNPLTD